MNPRRRFIEKMGKGAAFSTLALAMPFDSSSQWILPKNRDSKTFAIGIIGAENSHTAGFGKLFNVEKAFPGMEVKYVWGETDAFAKKAMKAGSIPNQVDDPNDMLGKIDGLIVDHRHGKFHLEPAIPFIEAGVPTFIDKPFCYRAKEGKEFLALARKLGTPVTSFSSIANSYDTFDIMEQLKNMGEIDQVVRYGPVDLDSEYGGVFFYGPHTVQPLLYLFGPTVERVRIQKNGDNSTASLVFEDGLMATLIFTTKKYGWKTYVETEEGVRELTSRAEDKKPAKNYVDMVRMFQTGEEPRSHESIIQCVAVLEALEKSVASEQWEKVANFDEI
ncbi:MAG TPA: Gfo/Idh/MocA family oxidoreductase [Pricia sp.]|nr:Gfo/Idh/MocA family oxidoreductase [Pricia sp.]